MSLDTSVACAEIVDVLDFPGIAVYDTEVPEEVLRSMLNGMWNPYLVLTFAGPETVPSGRHLTGQGRHDAYRNLLVVECCAMTAAVARQLNGKVVDRLVGFQPTDCDSLYPRGGGSYSRAASTVRPQTYVVASNFTFLSNMTWSD